ncbi:MAG: peptidoglycan-binding protein [Alphaproteobacteria bacterium]
MAEDAIVRARRLLETPPARSGAMSALGAAALAASAAVLMAGVMVLGPGVRFDEPAVAQPLFPNG